MSNNTYISDESAGLITMRDPCVLPDNGTYYLVGTQPPYWNGINNGVHMWKSKDLTNWTDCGLILKRSEMPESFWGRDRFWAPELFKAEIDKYCLTFNSRNEDERYTHEFGVGLAVSDNAEGPYKIITDREPLTGCYGNAIDGTIFRDDDGQLYLGCNSDDKKLHISKLDIENGTIYDCTDVCSNGEEGEWDYIGVEGQCIVKRHGLYFQWYSSWTHGYAAGLLTSDSINGPWTKLPCNPVLSEGKTWHKAGHNHCFRSFDGQDYISFHANLREPDGEDVERVFFLPVTYLNDGNVKIKTDG